MSERSVLISLGQARAHARARSQSTEHLSLLPDTFYTGSGGFVGAHQAQHPVRPWGMQVWAPSHTGTALGRCGRGRVCHTCPRWFTFQPQQSCSR